MGSYAVLCLPVIYLFLYLSVSLILSITLCLYITYSLYRPVSGFIFLYRPVSGTIYFHCFHLFHLFSLVSPVLLAVAYQGTLDTVLIWGSAFILFVHLLGTFPSPSDWLVCSYFQKFCADLFFVQFHSPSICVFPRFAFFADIFSFYLLRLHHCLLVVAEFLMKLCHLLVVSCIMYLSYFTYLSYLASYTCHILLTFGFCTYPVLTLVFSHY